MTLLSPIRRTARGLLASPRFNRAATTTAKALVTASSGFSQLATRHLFPIGAVRSRLPNGRTLVLWSKGDDGVTNHVFWHGWSGYQPQMTSLFYQLARRATVTLDIGAQVGFYTLLAAHANPNGWVYAFEPLPDASARLAYHLALNSVTNVTHHPLALGNDEGTAEMHVGESGVPISPSLSYEHVARALQDAPLTAGAGIRMVTVPITTVDRFVVEQELSRVDLIKIDVESHESQVLLGMTETLRRHQPLVFCEVLESSGTAEMLEELLEPLGYRYYYLTSEGPVPCPRITGYSYNQANDYLFTPLSPDELARLYK